MSTSWLVSTSAKKSGSEVPVRPVGRPNRPATSARLAGRPLPLPTSAVNVVVAVKVGDTTELRIATTRPAESGTPSTVRQCCRRGRSRAATEGVTGASPVNPVCSAFIRIPSSTGLPPGPEEFRKDPQWVERRAHAAHRQPERDAYEQEIQEVRSSTILACQSKQTKEHLDSLALNAARLRNVVMQHDSIDNRQPATRLRSAYPVFIVGAKVRRIEGAQAIDHPAPQEYCLTVRQWLRLTDKIANRNGLSRSNTRVTDNRPPAASLIKPNRLTEQDVDLCVLCKVPGAVRKSARQQHVVVAHVLDDVARCHTQPLVASLVLPAVGLRNPPHCVPV